MNACWAWYSSFFGRLLLSDISNTATKPVFFWVFHCDTPLTTLIQSRIQRVFLCQLCTQSLGNQLQRLGNQLKRTHTLKMTVNMKLLTFQRWFPLCVSLVYRKCCCRCDLEPTLSVLPHKHNYWCSMHLAIPK